jgi:hypothetical protein
VFDGPEESKMMKISRLEIVDTYEMTTFLFYDLFTLPVDNIQMLP